MTNLDEQIEEWLDVPAACRIIGGTRPINPATYYRGSNEGSTRHRNNAARMLSASAPND